MDKGRDHLVEMVRRIDTKLESSRPVGMGLNAPLCKFPGEEMAFLNRDIFTGDAAASMPIRAVKRPIVHVPNGHGQWT